MRLVILAGLLCASCNQIFGLDPASVGETDGGSGGDGSDGGIDACVGAACVSCTAHSQCDSKVCDLDVGHCVDETDVAYVQTGGDDGGGCTKALPCGHFIPALAQSRPFLKLTGAVQDQLAVTETTIPIVLFGDSAATITGGTTGTLVSVGVGATLTVHDVIVTGSTGSGTTGYGIAVPDGGTLTFIHGEVTSSGDIGVESSGNLTITRSTIDKNGAGGIQISGGSFAITNTFIVLNGGTQNQNTIGGVDIKTLASSPASVMDFDTIAGNNTGVNNNAGGLICETSNFAATNSIIATNEANGTGSDLGAGCSCTSHCLGPSAPDLGFVGGGNYHLTGSSSAIDQGDGALDVDIDGQPRPMGSGRDIGADEFFQ